jgi:dUTP pyrophosphatase
MSQFKFSKVKEDAFIPTKGTKGSAGYDLTAREGTIIPARGRSIIDTGIAIQIPSDCYGRVAPRSGVTWKGGLDVGAGVIDSDYTGVIGVILFNHTDTDYEVRRGDRVAQLIFEKIYNPELVKVEYGELQKTDRGSGGFGSTGA